MIFIYLLIVLLYAVASSPRDNVVLGNYKLRNGTREITFKSNKLEEQKVKPYLHINIPEIIVAGETEYYVFTEVNYDEVKLWVESGCVNINSALTNANGPYGRMPVISIDIKPMTEPYILAKIIIESMYNDVPNRYDLLHSLKEIKSIEKFTITKEEDVSINGKKNHVAFHYHWTYNNGVLTGIGTEVLSEITNSEFSIVIIDKNQFRFILNVPNKYGLDYQELLKNLSYMFDYMTTSHTKCGG